MSNSELADAIAATVAELRKSTGGTYSLLIRHLDELLRAQKKRAATTQNI